MTDPRIDTLIALLQGYARVAIVGAPRTGKTSLANNEAVRFALARRPVIYSDDFKHLAWGEVPPAIVAVCKQMERFLIEGVQVARALRRGLEIDAVLYLDDAKAEQLPGQVVMGKGIATVFNEWRIFNPHVHVVSPDRVPQELLR